MLAAVFVAMPYVLYQSVGIHRARPVPPRAPLRAAAAVSSIVLFYVGVAFAYFVVFPLMFTFLTPPRRWA